MYILEENEALQGALNDYESATTTLRTVDVDGYGISYFSSIALSLKADIQ